MSTFKLSYFWGSLQNQMEKSNDTAFEVLNKSEEELIKGGGGIQADSKGCTCKRGEFSCTTFG